MKALKRHLCLLLCVAMLLTVVLTAVGCGQTDEPADTTTAAGTAGDSIDHIMAIPNGATILQQYVMDDLLSATVSDHCPHFADVVLP